MWHKGFAIAQGLLIMTALFGCAPVKRPGIPLATLPGAPGHFGIGQILDLEAGARISFDDLIDRLSSRDLIFVGEVHDNPEHHLVQVQILQALAGLPPVAMAMEFFQRPAQEILDRYVRGEMKESEFLEAVDWKETWGYDFHLYRPLLQIAREKGIRVLAINAPSSIVRKVARGGLRGLTEEERNLVPSDIDLGNQEHREYLFKAYAEHASPDLKRFEDFYEAQCVWDETMAESLAAHLRDKGGRLVVFAGNGHIIHKFGVPDRTMRRFPVSTATVLPYPLEGGVALERGMADFVWLTAGYAHRFNGRMSAP
ncbi:MAG: ChaN family lipoprotein [Thermodesulfobacteriota bacterium]